MGLAAIARIRHRLRALMSRPTELAPLATRRERREAGRERHRETDEPGWSSADRHVHREGERSVADVSPGTPGHFGSVRTVEDD